MDTDVLTSFASTKYEVALIFGTKVLSKVSKAISVPSFLVSNDTKSPSPSYFYFDVGGASGGLKISSFICSFGTCLLDTCCMPDIVLDEP